MDGEENDFFLYECLEAVGLQQHYARFTAVGVHSAAHLSGLRMEDYPILGISSMEDRTQLFRLVQMIKSLDLWCEAHDSECNSSDSEENYHVADDGLTHCSCLGPDGDVYDLSGEGKRLNCSGKAFSQQQKESCYPSHVHISARHKRNAEAGQHKEAARPLHAQFVTGCLELTGKSNSGINHHNHHDHNTKTDAEETSTCSCHSPPRDLPHRLRSDTVPSMKPSNGQVWHKERKGISKKEKPCMEKSRKKALEQKAVTMLVYESRTAGYNYGLPLSSPPAPNKRQSRKQRISVCVRKRPLTYTECRRGEADVVATLNKACVTVNKRQEAVDLSQYVLQHRFYFDHVFGEESTNEEVYQRTAYPLVQHMLHRGSATCFAYGQTGSGKTHTMLGSSPGRPGLYALAVRDIFAHLSKAQTHPSLLVFVSFFEIYCGQLYDLLGGRKRLFAREDQQKVVHIAGLHEVRVESVGSLLEVISHGMAERTQGTSGVNAHSSRSHAMLQIQLRGQNQQMAGRMWFVDLAGSERASDTKDPDRQSRMEGAEINQSLLALKECIRSLDQAQSHTPFRQSKLTQVLKDSFLGDSMTCMIANISPGQAATEHTLNTLRYADRVKELRRQEGQGGRRSKTMSSKYDLSVNIGCNKNSVAARGKSPPKRPKLGRESENVVPISSTLTLTTDDTVFCSTPKNSSCARACFGTRLEQLTPIRGLLGISVQRESADRNGGRKEKDNGEPDQSIRAGANLGKLHLRDVRKKLEFSDRELEKELGILNRVTERKCQGGRSENRDTSPGIHRPTELCSQNTEQKEKERHLREYHQQLQQLMPSFETTPKHLLSSSPCQSFSCSHQVPRVSTSQQVSQNSVSARDSFNLETDSAPLGTEVDFESSYRGPLSSLTHEGLHIHNNGQRELGHGTLADTSKDVRVLMEDRKTKYGKETGNVEKERTKAATGEGQFILTQEYRRPAGMESGGKRRRAWETPAGSPQINAVTSARREDMETPLFEASTADTAHTESGYYCSSAEHLFSPPCGDTDTLNATKGRAELPHELKGRTCASNLATSTNSGVKESWVTVSDSQTLPHNTPNIHNEYKDNAVAFSVFCSTEDSACNQVGSHPDTDGKTALLSQGKADCASAIMDPLSISLLEVDQQVATASFLHGKESNSSQFESGGVQRDACNNFDFSISQSTSESVRNALPNWLCEGRSNHPSNISVQPNTLAETHVDESNCEFQIRPFVHPSTLGDMYHAQYRVVQAHWDQMEEMETLFRKEGKLLYQQPDMEFGEYIHKLGDIMARKARCIHGMLVQLQPYLKGIHSNQGNKHKDVINNLNE